MLALKGSSAQPILRASPGPERAWEAYKAWCQGGCRLGRSFLGGTFPTSAPQGGVSFLFLTLAQHHSGGWIPPAGQCPTCKNTSSLTARAKEAPRDMQSLPTGKPSARPLGQMGGGVSPGLQPCYGIGHRRGTTPHPLRCLSSFQNSRYRPLSSEKHRAAPVVSTRPQQGLCLEHLS